MDIALLYAAGMKSCGRVLSILPQSEIKSPEEYMAVVIKRDLLPALDDLLPRFVTKSFYIAELIKVDDGDAVFESNLGQGMDARYNAYRVPKTLLDGGEMIGIKNYFLSYGSSDGNNGIYGNGLGNMYPNRYGRYSSANIYARAYSNMINFADAQLVGTMAPSLRMKHESPNILFINKPYADNPGTSVTVTFKIANDPNLVTVPNRSFMGIKKLFVLYLKASIYEQYAMFSEIDTTTGNPVNLGISDWSSADADADQAFMELKQTAHFRNTSMMSG